MAFLGGWFSKFYLAVGAATLLGYLAVETQGAVFTGTDARPTYDPSRPSGSGGGRSGGGGIFFFGSGYRGGK